MDYTAAERGVFFGAKDRGSSPAPRVDRIDIIHGAWTADLDPRVSPARREAGDLTVGRMLINACRPYGWRDQFPKTNVFALADRHKVKAKWRDLLESLETKRRVQ
jgi:hypothetical protein